MKQRARSWFLLPVSVLSGFLNSLLGAGGGIFLSLALEKLFEKELPDRRDLLSNSQAAMIPGCLVSCLLYAAKGRLDPTGFTVYAIPAALGGAIGALLLGKLNSRIIGRIFAALVIFSGLRMLFF